MKRTLRPDLALVLVLVLGLAGAGCSGSSDPGSTELKPGTAVKVGAVLEMSGGTATYGEETRHGVELAL